MPNARFTSDQVSLLYDLVDASRSSKEPFLMLRTMGGEWLQHAGFAGGKRDIDYGDAVVLQESGLLTVTHWGNHGAFHFVVSPFGLDAYETWRSELGEAAAVVEDEVRRFSESAGFQERHPKAYECWKSAADLLWTKNAEDRVSDIGHHCREATQEFAESLLTSMKLVPEEVDKQKTKNRLAQALTHAKGIGKFGDAAMGMLNAMSDYWDALSALVMRQEHGGTKEGEALGWDDARALVFHTLVVMTEFDRLLS